MKDKNWKGKRSHKATKYPWIEKVKQEIIFGKRSQRKKAKQLKRENTNAKK
tara:strand:- start:1326 stop:1478 length:153 start_codon:yes stop_codon:yes gene_type:complete